MSALRPELCRSDGRHVAARSSSRPENDESAPARSCLRRDLGDGAARVDGLVTDVVGLQVAVLVARARVTVSSTNGEAASVAPGAAQDVAVDIW
jgi:hypothetical protein